MSGAAGVTGGPGLCPPLATPPGTGRSAGAGPDRTESLASNSEVTVARSAELQGHVLKGLQAAQAPQTLVCCWLWRQPCFITETLGLEATIQPRQLAQPADNLQQPI